MPDLGDLASLPDAGAGAAAALIHWAGRPSPGAERWWVVACDQVRWTPESLGRWLELAVAHDPEASRWMVARAKGRLQPLGGFLADGLRKPLAGLDCLRMTELVHALPHLALDWDSPVWEDVDTTEDLRRWEESSEGST